MSTPGRRYKGLLLDFGGVITTDFFASIDDHCERLGLPRGRFRQVVTTNPAGRELYQRIERGEISQPAFERGLAVLLGVDPSGLIAGMLAGLQPDQRIVQAAARARAAGIRVGVITNSWGTEPFDPYAGYHLHERYDAVIVSGEVGIRKPDPAIYLVAADKLGLPAGACVLVDDVAANLPPAAELGMATIHHVDGVATVQELEQVFGIELE
jgi:putative hydrolase of the HAD superfamily